MSRDSNYQYIHFHKSHYADLFEEFTTPMTSNSNAQTQPAFTTASGPAAPMTSQMPQTGLTSVTTHQSGTHIPHEDIDVPAHLQPPNPEDEDDVVPDMHAAFGITRAMEAHAQRERAWRDFESLRGVVRGEDLVEPKDKATGKLKAKGKRYGGQNTWLPR